MQRHDHLFQTSIYLIILAVEKEPFLILGKLIGKKKLKNYFSSVGGGAYLGIGKLKSDPAHWLRAWTW